MYFSALLIEVTKTNQKVDKVKKKRTKEEENFKRESVDSHHWEVWLDPGVLSLILGLIPALAFILTDFYKLGQLQMARAGTPL